jgi:hypothetical protein
LNSLKVCKDEKLDAYIPDIQYRKRDPRFAEQDRFVKKDTDPTPRRSSPPQTLSLMQANSSTAVRMAKS